MLPSDFARLVAQCAPHVSPVTMAAIVRTESGFNPYAIGVVRGRLVRQPLSLAEAVATARALEADGWNFSVGLAQVNRANWAAYGLNEQSAFDPCRNLAAGASVLERCFTAARAARTDGWRDPQAALRAGLSCYASGNFSTGYRTGYVQRVADNARLPASAPSQTVVPAIEPIPVVPLDRGVPAARTSSQPMKHRLPDSPDTASGTNTGDPPGSAVVF
ncbi:lytic transglycosylase domain-containing protein [Paraburkholderia phenoliruptrix]|uniref:lytic transglycosylase domain-containing protein n=1 Tax=Paraburkholderia phenoliruptrix TaxID=252970 RepID=UPI002869C703|nr:lytic transglycosylase domain-containing protein [Paraburkholderia phenoliruptrix]WMY09527.1 lytic transglycosylase domain-containing protein [Paraburkholderia phenoliruptrix]